MKKALILLAFLSYIMGFSQTTNVKEVYPLFKNCENNPKVATSQCFLDELNNHINKHLLYPIDAVENNISGKVMVTFTITTDGFVENISVTGTHELLEKEVLRVIKLLPQLKPALENGKPIAKTVTHPVIFRLQ